MTRKKTKGRLEVMEKEMEDLRSEMQRLAGLDRSVEYLTQSMARMMQSLNETKKKLAALILPRRVRRREIEDVWRKMDPNVLEVQLATKQGTYEGSTSTRSRQMAERRGNGETGQYKEENNWRRIRKLEKRMFCGDNPDGCLYHAERYFEANRLIEKEKLGWGRVSPSTEMQHGYNGQKQGPHFGLGSSSGDFSCFYFDHH